MPTCTDNPTERYNLIPAPGDCESAQLPVLRVPRAISQGIKRLGRKADHSPPSSVEVENGGAILPNPNIFIKHRHVFDFHNFDFKIFGIDSSASIIV
jgi:hypothetical protein